MGTSCTRCPLWRFLASLPVSTAGWRTSLVAEGLDPECGVSVPIVVGLVDTAAGGVQVAMRTGDGPLLYLAVQDANALAGHLNATTTARLRLAAERLGGVER